MIYRKAKKTDSAGIAAVLKECYNIGSLEEGMQAFEFESGKGVHYIVAEEDGQIAGLVSWFFHGLPKHQLAELDRIAVLPRFRRKGVARELFKQLVEDADKELNKHNKKLRKVFLMTHASNTRAHEFYEKLGLTHEATLKNHFYEGEDEKIYSGYF